VAAVIAGQAFDRFGDFGLVLAGFRFDQRDLLTFR
jgi:hypothetical protein